MDPSTLSGPFLAMMLLTLVVWLYMFVRRIRFLTSAQIDPDTLTPAKLAEISPPAVANPSDNLKNLFEMPVIFYALVLYLLVTGGADTVYVAAGWTFVGFRALHSALHCTVNIVMLRFTLYALSSLALWFMVLRAAFSLFG
jgi:hypothetical protein